MKYIVLIGFIVVCMAIVAQGAPAWIQTVPGKRCHNKYVEVLRSQKEADAAPGSDRLDVDYLPRCAKDGKSWKDEQCDHRGEGGCFCVNPKTGQKLEDQDSKKAIIELNCKGRTYKNDDGVATCRLKQKQFNELRALWDINTNMPLPYFPECNKDGSYMALQRDDTNFFCVDTNNGDKIPDTETSAGSTPPLSEQLCQSYSVVWNQFKLWKTARSSNGLLASESEALNQRSCRKGFVFKRCACPLVCTPGVEAKQGRCLNCRPACVCPDRLYLLNGKCISLEKCHTLKPASKVLHAEKLDVLTNGLWREYQENNPDAIQAIYEQRQLESEINAQHAVPVATHDFVAQQWDNIPGEIPIEGGNQPIVGSYFGAESLVRQTVSEGDEIEGGEQASVSDGNGVMAGDNYHEKPTYVDFNENFNPEVPEGEEDKYNPGKYPSYEEDEEYANYFPEEEVDETNNVFQYEDEGSATGESPTMKSPVREEEQMFAHQHPDFELEEFPTLQRLTEAERQEILQEFVEEPPCEDDVEEELQEEGFFSADNRPTNSEVAQEIYRVLEENDIIESSEKEELLANFENPEVIVKKSNPVN